MSETLPTSPLTVTAIKKERTGVYMLWENIL